MYQAPDQNVVWRPDRLVEEGQKSCSVEGPQPPQKAEVALLEYGFGLIWSKSILSMFIIYVHCFHGSSGFLIPLQLPKMSI